MHTWNYLIHIYFKLIIIKKTFLQLTHSYASWSCSVKYYEFILSLITGNSVTQEGKQILQKSWAIKFAGFFFSNALEQLKGSHFILQHIKQNIVLRKMICMYDSNFKILCEKCKNQSMEQIRCCMLIILLLGYIFGSQHLVQVGIFSENSRQIEGPKNPSTPADVFS